jgi:hypothetical protein
MRYNEGQERPSEHRGELLGVQPPKGGGSVERIKELVSALTELIRALAEFIRHLAELLRIFKTH